jgi:hypothetical protein
VSESRLRLPSRSPAREEAFALWKGEVRKTKRPSSPPWSASTAASLEGLDLPPESRSSREIDGVGLEIGNTGRRTG